MKELTEETRDEMDAVLARTFDDLKGVSTSEKIRRLSDVGYETADIARYLRIRYQFAYNVLAAPRPATTRTRRDGRVARRPAGRRSNAQAFGEQAASYDPQRRELQDPSHGCMWTRVEKDGHIMLPAAYLEALGVTENDQVQLSLEGDTVRVLGRAAALRELQAQVRRFVPEGVSLVDELIAERRAEAAREADAATDG